MKINGNIVSCAGNFALTRSLQVARGTSRSALVASCALLGFALFTSGGEKRLTRFSFMGHASKSCAGNFALTRSLQVARGTSRDVRHDVAFRLRMKWERQYRFITEIIHYPLHITNYKLIKHITHYQLLIRKYPLHIEN